jgi:hypothetical protein
MKFLTKKYSASVVNGEVSSISFSEAIDEPGIWNTTKVICPLLDRFEKADIAQSVQRRRHQSGADDDAHLIGDSGGVDHFADVAMKAFERSLWRFSIERTRRHIMCGKAPQ